MHDTAEPLLRLAIWFLDKTSLYSHNHSKIKESSQGEIFQESGVSGRLKGHNNAEIKLIIFSTLDSLSCDPPPKYRSQERG